MRERDIDLADVACGVVEGRVWIAHPALWMRLEPSQARAIGARLMRLADQAEGEVIRGEGGIGGAGAVEGDGRAAA